MSRRQRSVVTVLSGGLSLTVAACAGKDKQETTANPPAPVETSAEKASAGGSPETTGPRGTPSGRVPVEAERIESNPPRPSFLEPSAPTEAPTAQRLPLWDEVESGHPEGATNPPRPVLELLADGSRCWKAWEGGMRPPDAEVRAVGGRILTSASETSSVEIECPRRRVQAVLDRKAELDARGE